MGPESWIILVAAVLFIGFVVMKTRLAVAGRSPDRTLARRRLSEAKARARSAGADPAKRAQAWRDAAQVALDDLRSPNLAASLARRAERADPQSGESLRVIAQAMSQGGRYPALEKLLWRRIASHLDGGPIYDRAFDELIQLYEGAMNRPDQAKALRKLLGRTAT